MELPLEERLGRALEKVLAERRPADSWADSADALVIELAAHISFVPKPDYDRMVVELRKFRTGVRQ
jgi:hypothetical protein